MNKKILNITITCFSCLLLITGLAIADKPEWVDEKQAERELRKAEHAAQQAQSKIERKEEKH